MSMERNAVLIAVISAALIGLGMGMEHIHSDAVSTNISQSMEDRPASLAGLRCSMKKPKEKEGAGEVEYKDCNVDQNTGATRCWRYVEYCIETRYYTGGGGVR